MQENSKICENCAICCHETDMDLTNRDIKRILKILPNLPNLNNFYYLDPLSDRKKLVNIEGKCVFLDKNSLKCMIYEFRPEGCRFYPMLYNLDTSKCVLDDECPQKVHFYYEKDEFKIKCKELSHWVHFELLKK